MTTLYIDTSNRDNITVGLDDKMFTTEAVENKNQKLLPFIIEVLKKNKTDVEQLTAIKVNTGPGSFTGLRIGVAVANTMAWVLKIPVNGKKQENEIEYELTPHNK